MKLKLKLKHWQYLRNNIFLRRFSRYGFCLKSNKFFTIYYSYRWFPGQRFYKKLIPHWQHFPKNRNVTHIIHSDFEVGGWGLSNTFPVEIFQKIKIRRSIIWHLRVWLTFIHPNERRLFCCFHTIIL